MRGKVKPGSEFSSGQHRPEIMKTPGFAWQRLAREDETQRKDKSSTQRRIQPLTCFRQSCASLKPSTSRILRFDKGASNSPIVRVTGVLGQSLASAFAVGSLSVIVSLVALNTWKPSPSFSRHRRTISPRSRASIYLRALRLRIGGLAA